MGSVFVHGAKVARNEAAEAYSGGRALTIETDARQLEAVPWTMSTKTLRSRLL
jgi:hypothetical protein